MKGLRDMAASFATIDKIISTPTKAYTKKEAAEVLRTCGIFDNKNNIKPAFKGIVSKDSKGK